MPCVVYATDAAKISFEEAASAEHRWATVRVIVAELARDSCKSARLGANVLH